MGEEEPNKNVGHGVGFILATFELGAAHFDNAANGHHITRDTAVDEILG